MARPRTGIDTAGKITLTGQIQDESGRWVKVGGDRRATRWQARTKYRDRDGVLRDVTKTASTKGKAETALKAALSDRQAPAGSGKIRADMGLVDAGRVWLTQVDRADSKLSDSSRAQYHAAFGRFLDADDSTVRGLTLREANSVQVIERYLQVVADKHGTGSAKTARTVLSSVIGLAVRYGALEYNACREVRPAKASKARETERNTERALTRAEREHLLAVSDAHDAAQRHDVADVVAFMAGTGVRIGEALAQRWDDVDLDAGVVHVRGTKTEKSDRLLRLPTWLRDRLIDRSERIGTEGLVFPSPSIVVPELQAVRGGHATDREKVRDRRNVTRVIRSVFDAAGFPWATAHTLRRTVASLADEAGLSIAEAASQLGHADPAMTARVYLGKKVDTSRVAEVL